MQADTSQNTEIRRLEENMAALANIGNDFQSTTQMDKISFKGTDDAYRVRGNCTKRYHAMSRYFNHVSQIDSDKQ